MLRRAVVGLVLMSALPFVTAAHSEVRICVSQDKEDATYIVEDFETETPRLSMMIGDRPPVKMPCAASVPGKAFDCERRPGPDGTFFYVTFVKSIRAPEQMVIDAYLIQPRQEPQRGLAHQLIPSGAIDYQCRRFQ